jgi:hypothetical protein
MTLGYDVTSLTREYSNQQLVERINELERELYPILKYEHELDERLEEQNEAIAQASFLGHTRTVRRPRPRKAERRQLPPNGGLFGEKIGAKSGRPITFTRCFRDAWTMMAMTLDN